MMNLSTVSKINVSLFTGIAGAAICAIFSFTSGQIISGAIAVAVLIVLSFTVYQTRKLTALINKSNAILKTAAQGGDLNIRIIGIKDSGVIRDLQYNVNGILDFMESFARESSASLEFAARGDYYRKINLTGISC